MDFGAKIDSTISTGLPETSAQVDGRTPVIGYHVERKASGCSDRWIRITHQPVPETRYKVTEVFEGNEYQFRVSAENNVGVGPPGPESDGIVAKDPWGQCIGHHAMLLVS